LFRSVRLAEDSLEVSGAVSIVVTEGPRVHLIHNGSLPKGVSLLVLDPVLGNDADDCDPDDDEE
ncbi:hypothetical protein QHH03_31740, partial [Aphanizomenon sp. 202]|nr:hypothetical protein [Aphanizomenon sp. 202]